MKKRLLVIREPRSDVTKSCDMGEAMGKINLEHSETSNATQPNNAEVSSFWQACKGMEIHLNLLNRLTQLDSSGTCDNSSGTFIDSP